MNGKLISGCDGNLFVSQSGKTKILLTHIEETDDSGEYIATSDDGKEWHLIDHEDGVELIAK